MDLAGRCLIVGLLALSGCSTTPEVTVWTRAVDTEHPAVLEADTVIVFGRIVLRENGRSKLPYTLGKPVWQLREILPEGATDTVETPRMRHHVPFLSTDKDGSFVYAIPAGRYEMIHLEPFYYTPFVRPWLETEAAPPGVACYFGDLEMDYEATSWLGGLWGNYIERINRLEVIDRFAATRARVARRLPPGLTATRCLLTRIRGRFPTLPEPDVLPLPPTHPGHIEFGK